MCTKLHGKLAHEQTMRIACLWVQLEKPMGGGKKSKNIHPSSQKLFLACGSVATQLVHA